MMKFSRATIVLCCMCAAAATYIIGTHFWGLMRLGYLDSAIGTVRSIVAAEERFAGTHHDIGYTCVLSDIADDKTLRWRLSNSRGNGYEIEIAGCTTGKNGKPDQLYQVTARPLRKGMPALCSDQTGILWSDDAGSVADCLRKKKPFNN